MLEEEPDGSTTIWLYGVLHRFSAAAAVVLGDPTETDDEEPFCWSGALSRMVLVVVRQVGWGVAGGGRREEHRAQVAGTVPDVHNVRVRERGGGVKECGKEERGKKWKGPFRWHLPLSLPAALQKLESPQTTWKMPCYLAPVEQNWLPFQAVSEPWMEVRVPSLCPFLLRGSFLGPTLSVTPVGPVLLVATGSPVFLQRTEGFEIPRKTRLWSVPFIMYARTEKSLIWGNPEDRAEQAPQSSRLGGLIVVFLSMSYDTE